MTEREQIRAFAHEINAVCNRFGSEFEISYASLIGVLQLQIIDLAKACADDNTPEDSS